MSLEERFLLKLSTRSSDGDASCMDDGAGAVPEEEEEEVEASGAAPGRVATSKHSGPALSYAKPAPAAAPAPPPAMPRRSSMRVLTGAELNGVAEPVAILGFIKDASGTIRGKKNAVRANLEVITGRSLLNESSRLQIQFDRERASKSLVLYTSTNSVVRASYDRCNSVLKLLE